MDKNSMALLDIPGLVELSESETKEANGGFLVVLAFGAGFLAGCIYNKITTGSWLDPT